MILSHEQLKAIVAAGGAVIIEAPMMTMVQLRDLCRAAASGGGSLTIQRCSAMSATLLAELASLAPGRVTFDLTG